jgi:hypothetical protein
MGTTKKESMMTSALEFCKDTMVDCAKNSSFDKETVDSMLKRFSSEEFANTFARLLGIRRTQNKSVKRNKSAYMFFCQEQRPKVVSENANIGPTQIMSIMGTMWGKLDDKKRFNEMAELDKIRYQHEKEELKIAKKSSPSTKQLSSYLLYCEDNRKDVKMKNPSFNGQEVTRELGRMWNDEPHEKKQIYIDRSNAGRLVKPKQTKKTDT